MLKYIIKRIIGVIPTLIIVTTFVFFFVRLIPGDPARLVAGPQATLEDVEVVREELGLNKPIVTQYVDYVTGLFHGDLGMSLRTKRPVATEVSLRYMNTVKLALGSLAWSVVVGVLLGVWSGKQPIQVAGLHRHDDGHIGNFHAVLLDRLPSHYGLLR